MHTRYAVELSQALRPNADLDRGKRLKFALVLSVSGESGLLAKTGLLGVRGPQTGVKTTSFPAVSYLCIQLSDLRFIYMLLCRSASPRHSYDRYN